MIFLIYDDDTYILNDAYIEIGEFRTFLGGHSGVFVEPYKEVFEELNYVIGTQEFICVASNYYNAISVL